MPHSQISRNDRIKKQVEHFARIQRHQPDAVRVLAEGDSWFTHPNAVWKGKSLIGHLNDYKTINIVSMASPGDTLGRYPDPPNGQWRLVCNPDWLDGQTYDVVLISGGGNDVLGDHIDEMVRDKQDHPDKHGRKLIIQSKFDGILQDIASHIEQVRSTVDRHLGSDRPIFMHGYSYAQSSGREFELFGGLIAFGPRIQDQLADDRHIGERGEQQDIVNALVDGYNALLDRLQQTIPNFIHIDARPLLGPDDWDDEIHPNAPARRRLARHFREVIVDHVRA